MAKPPTPAPTTTAFCPTAPPVAEGGATGSVALARAPRLLGACGREAPRGAQHDSAIASQHQLVVRGAIRGAGTHRRGGGASSTFTTGVRKESVGLFGMLARSSLRPVHAPAGHLSCFFMQHVVGHAVSDCRKHVALKQLQQLGESLKRSRHLQRLVAGPGVPYQLV